MVGWRYYYRRYLGWLPVQFCMVCGRPYWGGWPRWEIHQGKIINTWQAWMMDYCSTRCAEWDIARLNNADGPRES